MRTSNTIHITMSKESTDSPTVPINDGLHRLLQQPTVSEARNAQFEIYEASAYTGHPDDNITDPHKYRTVNDLVDALPKLPSRCLNYQVQDKAFAKHGVYRYAARADCDR